MSRCPHCGAEAPMDASAGRVHACPRCGNPVLAAPSRAVPNRGAGTSSRERMPSPPRGAPSGLEHPRGHAPWKVALLAFAVLGSAYVGAYLLLTAEARKERAALVRGWPDLVTAVDPGPPPPGDDAKAVARWRPQNDLWEKRKLHESLSSRVQTVLTAMLAAFGVQTAITALLLVKVSRRPRGPPAGDAPGRRS